MTKRRDYNERGEVINDAEVQSHNSTVYDSYIPMDYEEQGDRSTFLGVTLIASPVIYSVLGILLNEWLEFYLDVNSAALIGAGFGLVISAIYSFIFADTYTAEDYIKSLGLPAVIVIALGIGYIILIIVIVLFVLAVLVGGG